jgi:hypothetical protein
LLLFSSPSSPFLKDALLASCFAAESVLCSLGEKQKTSEIGTRKKGNEEKITLTPPAKTQTLDPHFPKKKKKKPQ